MRDIDCSNFTSIDGAMVAPVELRGAEGVVSRFKVDLVWRRGSAIVVAGWCCSERFDATVHCAQGAIESTCLRSSRADVEQALGLPDGSKPAFYIFADAPQNATLDLRFSCGPDAYAMVLPEAETAPDELGTDLQKAVAGSLNGMTVGSQDWKARLVWMDTPTFQPDQLSGYVDHAVVSDAGGFVSGWVAAQSDVQVWIEDDAGHAYDLDQAYRWWRQDVSDAPGTIADGYAKTGFLRAIAASRGAKSMRLCGCGPLGRLFVPGTDVTRIRPKVRPMAKALFDVNTPRFELVARANSVDIPVLARLQKVERAAQARMTTTQRTYGEVPKAPEISIIIPLYDRYDMMELQLLEFAKDPDFADRVEVIYVNDDPRHTQTLIGMAGPMFDIVKTPFKIISAGDNRGFSAANNLGASHASGPVLVFMNSDVFPTRAHWLGDLATALEQNSDFGIIAPRLVFPDGSLQHIGMEPVWRDAFGVWTNRHPKMGFDVSCDPAAGVTEVPLVSGACVALRTADFEAVGGWSTDYFIGDFEDSDLCLRLAENGLKIGYHPDITLTHLERQSMIGIGEPNFREQITLLNAVLYNKRWYRALKGMME